MRSQISPEMSRLAMPQASMSESISAPRAAPKPRSVQYATMCTWGMAMATQQATPATHNKNCALFRLNPKGCCDCWARALPATGVCSKGGRWRMSKLSSAMPMPQNSPMAT